MPQNYVRDPEVYDFIVWDGTNMEEVIAAADGVVTFGPVGHIVYPQSSNRLYIFVVNWTGNYEVDTYMLPEGYALRTNARTVDKPPLSVLDPETVNGLKPYGDLYVNP